MISVPCMSPQLLLAALGDCVIIVSPCVLGGVPLVSSWDRVQNDTQNIQIHEVPWDDNRGGKCTWSHERKSHGPGLVKLLANCQFLPQDPKTTAFKLTAGHILQELVPLPLSVSLGLLPLLAVHKTFPHLNLLTSSFTAKG